MEDRTRSHLPFTWDANPAGLFAPTMMTLPPGNILLRTVFPLSRDLGSDTSARKAGDALIIVATLPLLKSSDRSTSGCTSKNGHGVCTMVSHSQSST